MGKNIFRLFRPYLHLLLPNVYGIIMKIDDKTIFRSILSTKGINFIGQLFQNNQQIKNGMSSKLNLI